MRHVKGILLLVLIAWILASSLLYTQAIANGGSCS